MDRKLKLLRRMCNIKKDEVGNDHFYSLTCGFMQFKDYLEIQDEEEYVDYIKKMCRDGYIKYDLHGYKDIKDSIIRLDTLGFEYLYDHYNKPQMGF